MSCPLYFAVWHSMYIVLQLFSIRRTNSFRAIPAPISKTVMKVLCILVRARVLQASCTRHSVFCCDTTRRKACKGETTFLLLCEAASTRAYPTRSSVNFMICILGRATLASEKMNCLPQAVASMPSVLKWAAGSHIHYGVLNQLAMARSTTCSGLCCHNA